MSYVDLGVDPLYVDESANRPAHHVDPQLITGPASFFALLGGGLWAGGHYVRITPGLLPLLRFDSDYHWQGVIERLGFDLNHQEGPALEIPTMQLSTVRGVEIVRGVNGVNLRVGHGGWINRSTWDALRVRGRGQHIFNNASHLRLVDLNLESIGWNSTDKDRCTLVVEGPSWSNPHGRGPLEIINAGVEDGVIIVRRMSHVLMTRGQFNCVRIVIEDSTDVDIDDLLFHSFWHGSNEVWVNGVLMLQGTTPIGIPVKERVRLLEVAKEKLQQEAKEQAGYIFLLEEARQEMEERVAALEARAALPWWKRF